jgi:beta-mannosidase
VKSLLKPGGNDIEIAFTSPFPYMELRNKERPLYEWIGLHEPKGRAWVRKEPCSYGWDWGPVLPSCGIWRGIALHAFDFGRLMGFSVQQEHLPGGKARLDIEVDAELLRAGTYQAIAVVRQGGKLVGTATCTMDTASGKGRATMEIPKAKLWWPVGMGEQPLYEVTVELLGAAQAVLGRQTKRVGLRVLKALPPEGNLPLRFEVNGIQYFAKGANMIPLDAFPNRVTPELLRRYITDAIAVNMNSLRFWGGGYYEEDELFDICDELGVCVWLDFKFACSAYPAFDEAFMENVRLEARDQVRRLRHHACIAVWCGNNEIGLMTKEKWSDSSMGKADYNKLFKDLIGQQVRELAPQANYVTGSPDCGDVHYWEVWHGRKPFEIYRTVDGFMSEFGFQSFPHPKTVQAFTTEADRVSLVSPVMKWHQRSKDDGNEKIIEMTEAYFAPARDFESAIWLSQILQGYGIKMGAEHWRQNMPRSMGCVFWQYNDCWPVASWSSVDYYGRWKALHYMARRFYAPVLVSGLEDAAKGTVDIFLTSDRLAATRGKVTWEITDLAGKSLRRESVPVEIPARKSQLVKKLDLQGEIQKYQAENLLTWLKVEVDGKVVSENLVTLVQPKRLKLADPKLSVSVAGAGDSFKVTLKSEQPALWAWLDTDVIESKYSDNFIHLKPGTSATITVRPQKPVSASEFKKSLRVRSLYDLCRMPA